MLVAAAVVVDNTILLEPNMIERVLVPLETKVPVVNPYVATSNIPKIIVVAPDTDVLIFMVVVPELLIVNAPTGLVLPVTVPVATIVAVKLVYVPALDNIKLARFKLVAAIVNPVDPKSNVLNQLPVVNVCTAVPLPVNVKLGALDIVPPVVPNENVLVMFAAALNPPVPVHVKPVAIVKLKLKSPAVVVDKIILLEPNAIERILLKLLLNVPIVKSAPPKFNVP